MITKQLLLVILVSILSLTQAMAIDIVNAEWLQKRIGDKSIRIADVADKAEAYDESHLPGAVQVKRYLDLGDTNAVPPTLFPTRKQFERLMSRLGIDNSTTVVAYDDKFGLFASRLLVIMEYYGHDTKKLKLLDGGIVNWKSLNYPITTDEPTIAATRYKSGSGNNIRITWSDVYRNAVLGEVPEVFLLDTRPVPEHAAKNIRSIRGGFIPSAVNLTGTDANVKETHTFKPVDEIRRMYEAKGVASDRIIYTYCHSGDRSAHAYITLKYLLGYKDVKVYDGGWAEWAALVSLPVAGQIWLWDAPKEEKK